MTVQVKCVHCGTMVHEFTVDCPECKKPVANKDAPVNVSESPRNMSTTRYQKKSPVVPIVIVVAVILAGLAAYYFLR